MNDFSELENELRKLRPLQPSQELLSRIEHAIDDPAIEMPAADNVVRPDRFRIIWSMGIGLAAAATLLLFARVGFRPAAEQSNKSVSVSPQPTVGSAVPSAVRDQFIPSGATQVVYHTRDEGLFFPASAEQPVRRLRSRTRETLQWQNAATGASLAVSYPSERVELIPISGQ
jgi:hypothetical protein